MKNFIYSHVIIKIFVLFSAKIMKATFSKLSLTGMLGQDNNHEIEK